jgi:hypothetical protein
LYYRGRELTPESAQYQWLEADLARSTKPWKFLFLHLPLMSSGLHADDDYNLNGLRDSPELAEILLPLARRHGVQMIFSAHDHAFERFRPVQGVHCIVTGGGGGTLYPLAELHPRTPISARSHCVRRLTNDSLHLRAVSDTRELLDEMFLERVPPPARPCRPSGTLRHRRASGDGDGAPGNASTPGNRSRPRREFSNLDGRG